MLIINLLVVKISIMAIHLTFNQLIKMQLIHLIIIINRQIIKIKKTIQKLIMARNSPV